MTILAVLTQGTLGVKILNLVTLSHIDIQEIYCQDKILNIQCQDLCYKTYLIIIHFSSNKFHPYISYAFFVHSYLFSMSFIHFHTLPCIPMHSCILFSFVPMQWMC